MTHHAKHFQICTEDTREYEGDAPGDVVDIDFVETGTNWRLRIMQKPADIHTMMSLKKGLSSLSALEYALKARQESVADQPIYLSDVERHTHIRWLNHVTQLLHREGSILQAQAESLRIDGEVIH
tara:strand:+ start:39964 stop:40338 length:375 start_codon:yes stop_codon:yes gene_type:complete